MSCSRWLPSDRSSTACAQGARKTSAGSTWSGCSRFRAVREQEREKTADAGAPRPSLPPADRGESPGLRAQLTGAASEQRQLAGVFGQYEAVQRRCGGAEHDPGPGSGAGHQVAAPAPGRGVVAGDPAER